MHDQRCVWQFTKCALQRGHMTCSFQLEVLISFLAEDGCCIEDLVFSSLLTFNETSLNKVNLYSALHVCCVTGVHN